MIGPFSTAAEVRRGYHSGLSGRMIYPDRQRLLAADGSPRRVIRFETAKYRPPFQVTLRTERTGWQFDHIGEFKVSENRWEFVLDGHQFDGAWKYKLVLDGKFWMRGDDAQLEDWESYHDLYDGHVLFGYEIKFETALWYPNHLVTLRNSHDGWGRDLLGAFRGNTWEWFLDAIYYPADLEYKLVLDRTQYMQGPNQQLQAAQFSYRLNDWTAQFAASPSAYRHGYDNFLAIESPIEQVTVHSDGTEGEMYDVIIVGSGMGGGTLADDLSDRGAKVLLLEAGGLWFPVHMNELPRSEVSFVGRDQLGHFVNSSGVFFNPGVHFNLGGRSVYWSGLIPRMQRWELRDVWPASVRDYLFQPNGAGETGYDRAEKLMKIGKSLGPYAERVLDQLRTNLYPDYEVIDLPRSFHQPDIDEAGELQNVLRRSNGAFSTADLLLDSLGFSGSAGRQNLRVNLHRLATRIETSQQAATAVVCQDLVGRVERRYRGRYIVLSCGSLESPKLAINSGLTDPNHKMGKGLTDHPAYHYRKLHELRPDNVSYEWLGDPRGHAKVLIRHTGATSQIHAYNIELLINAQFWDTRHADEDLWKRVVAGQMSHVEIKFIFDSPLNDGNSIIPQGEGRKPVVTVAKNFAPDHYKQELVDVRNRVLGHLGITGLTTSWVDDEWGLGVDGSVHHAGGTLRMSADGSGVVDEYLKFLAYDNLYCCDVSVSPSIPAANPSLTLTALAQRLSDTLAARLGLP